MDEDEKPITFGWVMIDSFENNILKVAEKYCLAANVALPAAKTFSTFSENESLLASIFIQRLVDAVDKDIKWLIGETPANVRNDAGRVISELLYMVKLLREKDHRIGIYIPKGPDFGLVFLTAPEDFYHLQLSKTEPVH